MAETKKKTSLFKRKSTWVALLFIVLYAFVFAIPYIFPAYNELMHPHKLEIGPQPTEVSLAGSPLNNTFFGVILTSLIFIFVVVVLGRGVRKPGSKLAVMAEMAWGSVQSLTSTILGHEGERYEVAVGSFFGFILIGNLIGLFSGLALPFFGVSKNFKMLIPPTTDLAVTTGLAISAIVYIHTQYIRVRGLKNYLGHYVKPFAFMIPINILEEISRPLSLAVRLFGNLTGEHIVLEVISGLVPFVIPIAIMVLGLFTGFVQALVFTMLFLVYLQSAISSKGGH